MTVYQLYRALERIIKKRPSKRIPVYFYPHEEECGFPINRVELRDDLTDPEGDEDKELPGLCLYPTAEGGVGALEVEKAEPSLEDLRRAFELYPPELVLAELVEKRTKAGADPQVVAVELKTAINRIIPRREP